MSNHPLLSEAARRARGRAAGSNDPGRFECHDRITIDDGWDHDAELPPLRTEVSIEEPRKVITRNSSPDLPFDRSINPYRGCEHGCIYCFARPTHAFLGWSPGLDFETQLIARPKTPEVLEKELGARSYKARPIALGTNTDPYQPIEKEHKVMRGILDVLSRWNHPVTIVTKGSLVERDIDLLAPMAARGLVQVGVSVTTLDRDVSRKMEPRVPAPERRLRVIETLASAGIPVRVCASPMIPGLTDHELESVLTAGRDAGAVGANYISLRLPLEVAPLFKEWLATEFPDRFNRVMRLVRDMHGGEEYSADWGKRMTGEGAFANLLKRRFQVACTRLGLLTEMTTLRKDLFARPLAVGNQMSLFD
jgi:DNA repair photolyase